LTAFAVLGFVRSIEGQNIKTFYYYIGQITFKNSMNWFY